METVKLKWLLGWLKGFKSRNSVCKRKQHSEAVLVNIGETEDCMIGFWTIIMPYSLKDVYNIDKTGLF